MYAHMNSSQKQLGSALIIITIIGGMLLIGVLGFVAWKAFVDTPKTSTVTTETESSDTTMVKTLSVLTWGVKVTVKSNLNTSSYIVGSAGAEDETTKVAALSISNLEKAAIYSGCGEKTLVRSSDAFASAAPTLLKPDQETKQIDTYTYAVISNEETCLDAAPEDQKETLAARLRAVPDDVTLKNLSAF